jgi:NitT/TauT family transport system substrate-binding protein
MSSCPNIKSNWRILETAPVAVLAVLLMSACKTADQAKASAIPVRIALTNTPLPYLPVFLADALGFYRQEGLSVTIDDFSSASKVMQALLGGSADLGAGAYEQDIQLAAEGRHVRSFVSILRHPSRVLVVAPRARLKIKRVEDLKGAVVGVAGLGSINHVFLNYLLLKKGVAPTEVKAVAIGTAASAVASIAHDLVDAAVLSGSETTIAMRRSAGVQVLVDARGPSGCRSLYGVDVYPTAVLYATDLWLRDHPDRARRAARALQRTLTWIATHSPEEVYEATPRRYRTENKDAELEALRIAKASFSRDGIMPAEGAEAVRKALAFTLESVRKAQIDLSQTYTNEFVESP